MSVQQPPVAAEPRRGNPPSVVRSIARSIPTMLVVGALGGLAWAGHHTGWKLPKFSELTGRTTAEEADWCEAHGVPESVCVECQPDLLPSGKRPPWCRLHGVPECPLCHPELAQLKSTPKITAADLDRAKAALEFAERPENARQCKLHERLIQFASQAAVEKAGIDIAPVWEAPIVESVPASGEIGYDQTRLAHLSSRVKGAVWRADSQLGERVRKDDVLALIDAADVGRAKSEFQQALAQRDLRLKLLDAMRPVYERGNVPEAKYRETESAAQEAAIRLATAEQALVNLGLPLHADEVRDLPSAELARRVQFLGLPEKTARALDPRTTTANLFPLVSPLDGLIVDRHVVAGEVVDAGQVLFVVADTSHMWLTLDVRMEDAQRVQPGNRVRFRPDAGGDVTAAIDWISTSVEEKTRTVRMRAPLENTGGRLRAGTFGTGQIILRDEPRAIVVPNEAVQWEGDCHVVFVRDKDYLKEGAPKLFHVRKVRIGAKDSQNTEIIAGVLPGEIVATRGSAVLRAQLLKNNLGEGCGCCHR